MADSVARHFGVTGEVGFIAAQARGARTGYQCLHLAVNDAQVQNCRYVTECVCIGIMVFGSAFGYCNVLAPWRLVA